MTAERRAPHLTLVFISAALLSRPGAAQDPALDSPSRSFKTGQHVTSSAYGPEGHALADLDGDGALDAALACYGNSIAPKVAVMRGSGDGTFAPPEAYPASGETMDVVAEDLDGDGDADLAFAQSSYGVSGNLVLVYLNRGDGTFEPERKFAVGKGPTDIAALDADGDGDTDLATPSWYWGEADVTVLYNSGAGTAFARADYPVPGKQPWKLDAGDVDGDGDEDLAVTVRDGKPALTVMENDGAGAFAITATYDTSYPYVHAAPVHLADVDLDGDLDALYGAGTSPSIYSSAFALFRNLGNGTFGAQEDFEGMWAVDFAVADATGDGWPDILFATGGDTLAWGLVEGDGLGGFAAQQLFSSGELAGSIEAGDADGDGDLDVVVSNHGSETLTVNLCDSGAFTAPPYFDGNDYCRESATGDLDGDGDADIVTADSLIVVLENDGQGAFSATKIPHGKSILDHPELADLDGDGDLDLLLLKNTSIGLPPYHVYSFLNDGSGGFGPASTWPLGSGGTGDLATFDMDKDGDADVVVTEYLCCGPAGLLLWILEGNGDGTFQPATGVFDFSIPRDRRVRTGDVDEDGIPDVVTGNGGTLVCWRGNGDGTFQVPLVSGFGDLGPIDLCLDDVDGDGHLDALGTRWGADASGERWTIAFGYGDGDFGPPKTYLGMFSLQLGGVAGIDTLDADQDGDLDVVCGAYTGSGVSVFRNNGDRTFAPEERYGVTGSVSSVLTDDFDGDGLEDVAANASYGLFSGAIVNVVRGLSASPWKNLGHALAGTHGAPVLAGHGQLVPGAPVSIAVSNALEQTLAAHVFGTARLDLPIFGGVLVPTPDLIVDFTTDPSGAGAFAFTWPAGPPPGWTLYAQTFVIDPGAPQGVAASNALLAVKP